MARGGGREREGDIGRGSSSHYALGTVSRILRFYIMFLFHSMLLQSSVAFAQALSASSALRTLDVGLNDVAPKGRYAHRSKL